ncbi:MAG: hypothetical protein KDC61_22140 [Saprospiraceae bacterium]|nr:hypothetical protein [Saprospiraceae bacterium]MCB0577276.1 hypothetical protein [Saprospiraceae bacterium]MCB9305188.1 hypothetical protein [Lewinellaceae bacterium]MCB9355549.1 hypothetical protein [Lewinellaceae bacterium]
MNTKVLLAALAGAVAFFLLGWAFYGVALSEFFASNMGSATGVQRGENDMVFWALFLGNFFWALLIAIIFDRWASISTFRSGAMSGGMICLLMALGIDLIMYGTTNISNLTATLVDPIVSAIMGAISGGLIGWVLGYGRS